MERLIRRSLLVVLVAAGCNFEVPPVTVGESDLAQVDIARPPPDIANPDLVKVDAPVEMGAPDLAQADIAGQDLAGADLTMPSPDLTMPSVDLAMPPVDLAMPSPDLTLPPVDLKIEPDLTVLLPSITSALPASGLVSGGTEVTITGKNFVNGAKVTFGTLAAKSVTFVDATTIKATSPTNPGLGGAVTITVTNPDTKAATVPWTYVAISKLAFGTATAVTTAINSPQGIASGYFNSDSNLDLAIAVQAPGNSPGDVEVFFGDGKGGFSGRKEFINNDKPRTVVAADLNKDGFTDLVVAANSKPGQNGNVTVYLNDGAGNFTGTPVYSVGNPFAARAADITGDGTLDIVVAAFGASNVVVLPGTVSGKNYTVGAPQAAIAGAGPAAVGAGDFNADKKLDVAAPNYQGANVSLFTNSNGMLTTGPSLGAGTNPVSLVAADVIGDPNPELIVANYAGNGPNAGSINIYTGKGDGTFVNPPTQITAITGPYDLDIGDFNVDAAPDVAVAMFGGSGQLLLLVNAARTALTSAAPQSPIASGAVFAGVTAGDFNNDGKPDLAGTNFNGNQVFVFLNTSM